MYILILCIIKWYRYKWTYLYFILLSKEIFIHQIFAYIRCILLLRIQPFLQLQQAPNYDWSTTRRETNFIASYKCPKIFTVDCERSIRSIFRKNYVERKIECSTCGTQNSGFVLCMKVTRSTEILMQFHFEYACLSLWFYAKFSWCVNCV